MDAHVIHNSVRVYCILGRIPKIKKKRRSSYIAGLKYSRGFGWDSRYGTFLRSLGVSKNKIQDLCSEIIPPQRERCSLVGIGSQVQCHVKFFEVRASDLKTKN